jgi:hypothetical protein
MVEDESIFSQGIGDKESKRILQPKPVIVMEMSVEKIIGKPTGKNAGKEVGKKLVLLIKHPDKEEIVKISQIVIIVGKSVKTSTLWLSVDDDGKIQKGSEIAILLEKYNAKNIEELVGMTLQTEAGEDKFLAIKGY